MLFNQRLISTVEPGIEPGDRKVESILNINTISDENCVDTYGYREKVKFCGGIIRETAKHYGIQFSPLSRIYSNLLMSQDDVRFFEERIFDAMVNARKIIDTTFKEGIDT